MDKLQKSILPLCWLTFHFPSPIRPYLCTVHCYNAILSCTTLGSNFDLPNQHLWKPTIANNYLREIKVKWLLQPTFKTSILQKTILGDERVTWRVKTYSYLSLRFQLSDLEHAPRSYTFHFPMAKK